MGYLRMVALEQDLVEACSFVEGAESDFEPLDCIIPPGVVEALVVDASDWSVRLALYQ
jgi:hypothetical protein